MTDEIAKLPVPHPAFGGNLAHFVLLELLAYRSYVNSDTDIRHWRIHDKSEVDFVLNGSIGIEVKGTAMVTERDLVGLKRLAADTKLKRQIIVSRDRNRRKLGTTEIFPIAEFLQHLWANEII